MNMRRIPLLSLIVAVSICSHAQTPQIQTLRVQSGWGGLGEPAHSDFSVQRQGDSYSADGQPIPGDSLAALMSAIQEAPVVVPKAANLGITARWLQEHADQAGGYAGRLHYEDGISEQKALFREAFEDRRTLSSRVKQVYETFHTDDYPHLRAQLVLQNGTHVTLFTNSQNPYMLPWCLIANGTATKTYNANISRALFALLPPNFTNRERLIDEADSSLELSSMLGEEIGNSIVRRWNQIGVEHASGAAMAVLRRNYVVRSAILNSYNGLAFGKDWDGGKSPEENLQADLWRQGFPKGFTVTAFLLRRNGNTEGARELLKRAPQYENMVLSVSWLDAYLKSHPTERASLFYVHGESLTDKAMQVFAEDMNDIGRNDIAERVSSVRTHAALLESGFEDYWIILPDKTAIMWRRASRNRILKWKANEFPVHECRDYRIGSDGCAGVVISPDGVPESTGKIARTARACIRCVHFTWP
jgi:hypothetical protein